MTDDYYALGKHSYMRYDNARFASYIYSLVHHPLFQKYDVAIELGAGMGRFSPPLVENFKKVFLIEPSNSYAEFLRKEFAEDKVSVLETVSDEFFCNPGDAGRGPAAVFCFHLMHHISAAERRKIFDYVREGSSLGIVVEPNPINPLILIQVLLTKDMSFKEEAQYLQLNYRKYKKEIEAAGLRIITYKRLCIFPPFLGNFLVQKFPQRFLRSFEFLSSLLPFLGSYQLIIYGNPR